MPVSASFAAWSSTDRRTRYALLAICALHAALLGYGAWVHSPTYNEAAHLTAGISYWQFGRFDVYSVNPPLVKMAAALPVLAAGCETDWSSFYQGPGARPEMGLGEAFVHANGERSLWLVTLGRWACIPFSVLGAVVCYAWARDLAGPVAGLLAASLWSFSPSVLGHGQLLTPDVHASALGAAACYVFWRWLKRPSWMQAIVTGFVLGLAELSKTTLVVFYPLWPLLWLVYRLLEPAAERLVKNRRDWMREAGMLAVRMAVGVYALNLGYGFEGSMTQLGEFYFVSQLFGGEADSQTALERDGAERQRAKRNRFAGTWLGRLPVPFPKHYLVGIDLQQRDFEGYGFRSYMAGRFQQKGWLHYYAYVLAVKAPLGMWALAGVAAICAATQLRRRTGVLFRDQALLLFIPGAVFAVVSSKSGFSEHGRYILPCFPLFFVWVGATVVSPLRNGAESGWKKLLVGAVAGTLIWAWGSVLWRYPHTLSYFNEAAGGPLGGPQRLLHSNIDWGQDLLFLRRWMEDHPQAHPLRTALFCGFNPADVGLGTTLPAVAEQNDDASVQKFPPGWYAVSVNLLYGYDVSARDGSPSSGMPTHAFSAFLRLTPRARAGYSIYIYKLDEELEIPPVEGATAR